MNTNYLTYFSTKEFSIKVFNCFLKSSFTRNSCSWNIIIEISDNTRRLSTLRSEFVASMFSINLGTI